MSTVRLHKHHALGNDFLVLVAGENDHVALDAALAVHACARHAGVGADGLMRVGPGSDSGVDLTMELLNADGSAAEMSGNGLRCLVQAAQRAGHAHPDRDEVLVQTAAGIKAVRSKGALSPTTDDLVAEMGAVKLLGDTKDWLGPGVERAAFADVGNPHLVMLVPDATHSPPLEDIGKAAQEKLSHGANVELITPLGDGRLGMQVYERGVGRTLACGTGACAAAAVARSWGLAGDQVPIEMAGGESVIGLRGDDAFLGGPVTWVGDVDLAWPA